MTIYLLDTILMHSVIKINQLCANDFHIDKNDRMLLYKDDVTVIIFRVCISILRFW